MKLLLQWKIELGEPKSIFPDHDHSKWFQNKLSLLPIREQRFLFFFHWQVPTLKPRNRGKSGLRLPQSQQNRSLGTCQGRRQMVSWWQGSLPFFLLNPHVGNSDWQESSQHARLKINQPNCPALCSESNMTRKYKGTQRENALSFFNVLEIQQPILTAI